MGRLHGVRGGGLWVSGHGAGPNAKRGVGVLREPEIEDVGKGDATPGATRPRMPRRPRPREVNRRLGSRARQPPRATRHPGRRLRIALIGPARFGIGEPYAGGLEAHTTTLARALQRRGHSVTVFAGPASAARPGGLRVIPLTAAEPDMSGCPRTDNAMPPGRCESEDEAYRRALATIARGSYDVIHNNSLHYLLPVLGAEIAVPVVHVLHTPPFDWLTEAHEYRVRRPADRSHVVAVSHSVRAEWKDITDSVVVHNGVPIAEWPLGRARRAGAVWAGRIVPEKAPHLAIDAALRAGVPIVLAGPVQHLGYFEKWVVPRLGPSVRHVGHLGRGALARLFGRSEVGVVTPEWDEPFGLVAAELLMTGTPVAAFDRGGLREFIEPEVGVLVRPGDVDALAVAIASAGRIDGDACRAFARGRLSDTSMARAFEVRYRLAMRDAGISR